MKMLMFGLIMTFGTWAVGLRAQVMLIVDGEEFEFSALMETCKSLTGDPEAKLGCFNSLTELLDEQSGGVPVSDVSVADTLDALREVSEYQDGDSGLSIIGEGCNIQFVYFGNYFHISRRNVSTIDLFSAQFDASSLQYDQFSEVKGSQALLLAGLMEEGTTATTQGGEALDSSAQRFAPKSARTTTGEYALEVVTQLPAREEQAFDFVLVHPQRHQARAEILIAFEAFVNACKN